MVLNVAASVSTPFSLRGQTSERSQKLCKISDKIIETINNPPDFSQILDIRHQLKQITIVDLHAILQDVSSSLLTSQDPVVATNTLASIVKPGNIEKALRTEFSDYKDALESAKSMFEQASYYLEKTKKEIPSQLKIAIQNLVDSCIVIIERILTTFGIADFFKPIENEMHADYKSQRLFIITNLFQIITGILAPIVGPVINGLITGGSLLFIAGLSLVYPAIKPIPQHIPKAINWTQLAEQGKLNSAHGRRQVLDDIAETLHSNKGVKTHPMLIGKTGIGKTETIKAFVNALNAGKYPALQGKKVFYINTADIVNNSDSFISNNAILNSISEAMGNHREDIILVFDEIHLACQKKENSAIGEQLKTRLDPSQDGFPYVIGITTEEEFYRDIYLNNPAFARRFKRIAIESTDEVETIEILNNTLLKQAPNVLVEKGAIQNLVRKVDLAFTNKAAQPATAIRILSSCIQKTNDSQKSPLLRKVERTYDKIQSLRSLGAVGHGSALLSSRSEDHLKTLETLQKELKTLEEELRKENEELNLFFAKREKLSSIKKATFEAACKVAALSQQTLASHQNSTSLFLLLSHYVGPAFEKSIQSEAKKLQIETTLNDELIQKVINEELENMKKAKACVAEGQKQLKARKQK
jgi:ATP-dependent Clp protease ATP-binding subunit ClpA